MANAQSKLVVIAHLTLDGVYQAPAKADEDNRGNFKHGGWSAAGDDPKLREAVGKYMTDGWSMLAGRTTYEDLYNAWPVKQPGEPMSKALTTVQKFVASHNPDYSLPWENSALLSGDVAEKVAQLKKEHDKPIVVFGSGVLVRSLMEHDLVDEFLLLIHPLLLGEGLRFFDDHTMLIKLKLVNADTAGTGVVIATYATK